MKIEAATRLRANNREMLEGFANYLRDRLKVPAFSKVKVDVVQGPRLAIMTDWPRLDVRAVATLLHALKKALAEYNSMYEANLKLDTNLKSDNPVFGPSKANPGYIAFYL